MKRENINKIISFIQDEINDYPIEFDYEIEDDILIAKFNGHFNKHKEIEMDFIYDNGVEFQCIGEYYIEANTRSFWIEYMTRLYE